MINDTEAIHVYAPSNRVETVPVIPARNLRRFQPVLKYRSLPVLGDLWILLYADTDVIETDFGIVGIKT